MTHIEKKVITACFQLLPVMILLEAHKKSLIQFSPGYKEALTQFALKSIREAYGPISVEKEAKIISIMEGVGERGLI